jgi:hypothetical protein
VDHYGFSGQQAETQVCEFEKDVRWPGAVKWPAMPRTIRFSGNNQTLGRFAVNSYSCQLAAQKLLQLTQPCDLSRTLFGDRWKKILFGNPFLRRGVRV